MARAQTCDLALFVSRQLRSGVVTLFLVSVAATPAVATEPADFLVEFGRRASAELTDPALDPAQKEQRFRELLNEAVDLKTIARFILGRFWRSASADDRAAFLEVFEDMATQRLLPMFDRRPGERQGESFDVVDISRPSGRSKDVLVHTLVARKDGASTSIVWRLREQNPGFKIIDVSAEGVSMALTLRQEYGSAVQRLGGVGALVQELRSKLGSSKAAAPSNGATN